MAQPTVNTWTSGVKLDPLMGRIKMNGAHPLQGLSATTVQAALPRREAAPLRPTIRRFMEERFEEDFGDVRIHTGPGAEALCWTLNARAFTLGRDIAFGAGQYAPAGPAGRRRLAHELVHVLQQRAAGPPAPSGLLAVGDPRDACEREADRLADEALGTGLRSPVTPDAARVIRREAVVLESQASLTVDAKGAMPGVDIAPRLWKGRQSWVMIVHLTRNKGRVVNGSPIHSIEDMRAMNAIYIKGTVPIQAETIAEIEARWEFHLFQLIYPVTEQASYAGRTTADGSMVLDVSSPGKYPGYLYDSYPKIKPKSESEPASLKQVAPGLWEARVELYDHPNGSVPVSLPNFAVKDRTNYLYAYSKSIDFVTAFVLYDSLKQTYKILWHLSWRAAWDVNLRWTTNEDKPDPKLVYLNFYVDDPARGDPTGRGVADMIKHTSLQDTYGTATKDARDVAIRSSTNNKYVQAESRWTPWVPRDFYK